VDIEVNGEYYRISREEVKRGYTEISCPSCGGSGVFRITDIDFQDCVECSTRGIIVVGL